MESALDKIGFTTDKRYPLKALLKNELKRWACKYGSTFWTDQSTDTVFRWKEKNIYHTPDSIKGFLECAMRNASDEDWQFVFERYEALRGINREAELDSYRDALASIKNTDALEYLLESAYGDKEEYAKVLKAIVKSGAYGNDFAFLYIIGHRDNIENMYVSAITIYALFEFMSTCFRIGFDKAMVLVTKGVLSAEQNKKVGFRFRH